MITKEENQVVKLIKHRINELFLKIECEPNEKKLNELVKLVKINEDYYKLITGRKYTR